MKAEGGHAAGCLVNLGRWKILRYDLRKIFSSPELKTRIQQQNQEDTMLKNYLIL